MRQIVSVGEYAEKLGHLYIVGRNVIWWNNLESGSKVSQSVKHKVSAWPRNSTPGSIT